MLDIDIFKKLDSFDLNIKFKSDKKCIAIVGKSGSGKTTLIRCIAGFEKCKGSIKINNQEWIDRKIQQRDFGIVFQNYALFPNMNVYQNLKFACKNEQKIEEILTLLEITHLKKRYPKDLSGGEAQRVAIGRALINNPKILILDEPFSALDYSLKDKLYKEIELIKKHFDTKIILISHDIAEVYRLSDEIIEIEKGKIKKIFTPTTTKIAKKIDTNLVEINGEVYEII